MRRVAVALLTAAFSFGWAQSVTAADMPVKAAPPVAAAPSWTGFYLGLSLGGRWATNDSTVISIGGAAPGFPATASRSSDTSTFRVGGYFGYNWQVAPLWVVGLEGDVAWGDGSETTAGLPGATAAAVAGDSTESRNLWDASLRGRAGFLLTPSWLLYGTGGVAWQNVEATSTCGATTCPVGVVVGGTQTNTTTRTGWTVGGGIEGMVARNWLARVEYRYADFGTWQTTHFSGATATVSDIKIRTHTALFGIAYKF